MYLSSNSATAAMLSAAGHAARCEKCFTLRADSTQDSESRLSWLISQTAKKISDLDLKFDELTLSIDCGMYAQHDIQSEFTDRKQIEATIAFDAEEAVATDANELAVTFNITGKNKLGANVTVFTSKRELIVNILEQFKTASLDPIYVEPDIVCLDRYLKNIMPAENSNNTLEVVIAPSMCYMICPSSEEFGPSIRSFLIYPEQDIVKILQRQIPITLAALAPKSENEITAVRLTGNTDGIDINRLKETTGLNVGIEKLWNGSPIEEGTDESSLAIAYGCALCEPTKSEPADFRKSFLPFEGKKRMLQKSFKLLMTYLTVLLIALGAHFQLKVMKINSAINEIDKRSKEDYSAVMFGKKPKSQPSVATQLMTAAKNIKKQGGMSVGDETSVPAQLTYIVQAINTLPDSVKLEINKITISARSITIIGSTQNRRQSLALLDAIKKHPKLEDGKKVFNNKPGTGDTFTISANLL